MKKVLAFAAFAGLTVMTAMAADWTGYIIDSNCASKKGMRGNEKCANDCLAKGAKLVFVTPDDGKIYQVTEQDKVTKHAGHKVTITGKMDGETISKIDNVKM